MPKGYEFLLERLLKPEVQEEISRNPGESRNVPRKFKTLVKAGESDAGVPQGGIISPMLMN